MYKLFSERIRNDKGELEIYEYISFSKVIRNQIFFIISDILDIYEKQGDDIWKVVHDLFAREKGLKALGPYSGRYNGKMNVEHYIDNTDNADFLDLVDFVFTFISKFCIENPPNYYTYKIKTNVEQAVAELNYRLKQLNMGYEFIKDEMIRIDNKIMHETVIKPALHLLYTEGFEGPEEEFRKAFEYRKKGDNKNAILEALKSFESTMKTICDKRNYPYDKAKDTAQKLIKILEDNSFYPTYLNSHLTNLRTTLETGLPVLRNKQAGHGQGASVVNVSDEFTEYALNLAATNIVLMVKIYINNKL